MEGVAPEQQVDVLLHELAAYRPELLERPRLVVGTKLDSVDPATKAAWDARGHRSMSSVTGAGYATCLARSLNWCKRPAVCR